eukprot:scaffold27157_cov152-Isochrysis_galbana.AAC.2
MGKGRGSDRTRGYVWVFIPPSRHSTDLSPCAFGTLLVLGARTCPLCVSWVRRWPRTGLANRPPLCLPDPPPPLSPTKGI